ncbi:MAG TPA: tetratricopeptide repeat protein [Ferruginibacter sp.]|nr:tetratricopeptide repeat protein [Ferruginibacter sp.]
MKKQKIIFSLLAIVFSFTAFAQPTAVITDPQKNYKEAKELFIKKEYALAYPLLKELKQQYPENQASNNRYIYEDVNYYYIVCGLKLQLPIAADEAINYIYDVDNEPRTELMSYHLAKYNYLQGFYSKAIQYYEASGYNNLSTEEVADKKFELGYSYFNIKQFAKAKPLFAEIQREHDSKYYIQANYYYGFICFYDHEYAEALSSFAVIENLNQYKSVVPYYVAEILYFENKKDEAAHYTETALSRGGLYYEKEMKQLLGQIYFEQMDFKKALPLLEYYVGNSKKITKETQYELSYCYYKLKQIDKAIEGFKQLSNEKDSLGQNSMYILADCYLHSNQKENARSAFQYCADNNSNKEQQEVSAFNYAKLSYELNYQDIALSSTKKFLTDYPNSNYIPEAKEILVSLLANTNNFTDALALYQSFDKPTASMQKVYPRILYGKAVEYINDQQITMADDLLTKIIALPASSVTPYANFWKGEIAYRLANYDEAIRHLTAYLDSHVAAQGEANPMTAKYDIGYSWLKKENYHQALPYFEQIEKSSSSSLAIEQDAYVRAADCYYMNKDLAKANSMYENVLTNALPESDYALFQKAMIVGIKNPGERIQTFASLIHQYPKSNLVPDANLAIADVYMANEKFSNAIPYLTAILAAPDAGDLQPKAYLKLGLIYYNTNNNKDALNNYTQLIQNFPQSPEADEALENVKNIYIQEGKPNDYITLMNKIGKNISDTQADSLTYTTAELQYMNSDCTNATTGFTNYLSKYPNGHFVLEANYYGAECYSKNKDWTNALKGYDYVSSLGANKYFERATLAASRINYFELKDYAAAEKNFQSLRFNAVNQDNKLEALRGLVRSEYQLKDYAQADTAAKELLTKKGISTDDKSIADLVLGKSLEVNNDSANAIIAFRSCAAINRSAWGAEARYEIASCQFSLKSFIAAQKAAMAVIKETNSYDYWVTRSYILLGDIFEQKKDYFNAKATYQSVVQNSTIDELKTEAQQKLDKAIAEEADNSKITN